MNQHFDRHLCVRDFILEHRPKLIVECGGAEGANTLKILSLQSLYPFQLITISDNASPLEKGIKNFTWKRGISYQELCRFDDATIDLCIIDTDHNYPDELAKKIKK